MLGVGKTGQQCITYQKALGFGETTGAVETITKQSVQHLKLIAAL